MFNKMKVALTATAAAGVLATAGAAGASAATVTGGGTFSANAPAGRLVFTTGVGIPWNCSTTSGSGTVTNGTYTPAAFPGTTIGEVTPALSGCIGPLGLAYMIGCATVAPNKTMLNITGSPVAGTTPGSVTGIDCVITFPAANNCSAHVKGSVLVSYTNPTSSPAANGKLTVLAAGQNLTMSASTCPPSTGLVNGGQVDFGGQGSGTLGLTNLVYTLTTTGPTIS